MGLKGSIGFQEIIQDPLLGGDPLLVLLDVYKAWNFGILLTRPLRISIFATNFLKPRKGNRKRVLFCVCLAESMFNRRRFLSLPMVIGAVVIGIVSGKAIFGPPVDEYWKKKLEEEATAKETDTNSS
ncbi:hypothetical protein L1887_36117 [Cichorium endivia]|nr:hypothetical protein L1887_36117 [Cichorium endivia]